MMKQILDKAMILSKTNETWAFLDPKNGYSKSLSSWARFILRTKINYIKE